MCPPGAEHVVPSIAITEPRDGGRYLWDPDTPPDSASIRLAARVQPADEEIVWLVDGVPVGRVGWPHTLRWPLQPGRHVIEARMARTSDASRPVRVTVID
jgi:hypothetical protein